MFTTTNTTDHSIDRWTDDNGYEYAYSYDHDAENPFDWGWEGLYVMPFDHRRIDSGDEQIRRELDAWLDDLEQYQTNLDEAETSEDAEIAQEALLDHEASRPDIETFEYSEWQVFVDLPEFRKSWGFAPDAPLEALMTLLRGHLDTYRAWCNGEVYVGGVTTPDGETDYLGGIYLDDARDDREQIEEMMRDFV